MGSHLLIMYYRIFENAKNITKIAIYSQVPGSQGRDEEGVIGLSGFWEIRGRDSCVTLGFIPPREGFCKQYQFHVIVNEEKSEHHFD